jgi:hypothetical protein
VVAEHTVAIVYGEDLPNLPQGMQNGLRGVMGRGVGGGACKRALLQASLLPTVILHLLEPITVQQLVAGVLEVGQG